MPVFRVILYNHLPTAAERILRWTVVYREGVARELQRLFEQVCAGSPYTASVTWVPSAPSAPAPNGLVLHFVRNRASGLIQAAGGPATGEVGGATWCSGQGVISEVYVQDNTTDAQRLARLGFHELMHNKLDAVPGTVMQDIHADRRGRLTRPDAASQHANAHDLQLMRNALGRVVRQYVPVRPAPAAGPTAP